MELFQWGTDPWGQEVLIRVAWDLLYLAFWAGVACIVFHLILVRFVVGVLQDAQYRGN